MLHNVVDPNVAKDSDNLIVYGGTGKAARNWECFERIAQTLRDLQPNETLLVQSGKPVAVFETHEYAPRVLISNAMLVPKWATWDYFYELEQKGLIMYGQMTAGSWAYIGTQGILQGTYETFASVARKHFAGSLKGRVLLTAGLGEMGGAQPLAMTMNEGIALVIEIDKTAIDRRLKYGLLEKWTDDIDEALSIVTTARNEKRATSVGLLANAAEICPELIKRGIALDIVTDQTSAHDPLHGYYPFGLTKAEADTLRKTDPQEYLARAKQSIKTHVKAMIDFARKDTIVFEYGNNIRQQAFDAGLNEAFSFPGFVPEYIRPMFCEGRGPFRWTSLVGEAEDIFTIDKMITSEFGYNKDLVRWLEKARDYVKFQGLPARVCWLGYGERARFGKRVNEMVASGKLSGPIWVGRDHLDTGSVASPRRETESMKDGSDAIADWPILNALLNTAAGASWVSVHHGGGVGIGYSIHAGMCLVLDGKLDTEKRARRVLTTDPGIGVVRHADAGYAEAVKVAKDKKIKMPMLS